MHWFPRRSTDKDGFIMSIYLDNAATTKPCAEAVEAITAALTDNYGNPSSLHRAGLDAQLVVDKARKSIAKAIGCDSSGIVFTSGATESNNLALRGASAVYGKRRKRIVVSSVEHASVAETIADLGKSGFEIVRVCPNADGEFSAADFIAACDENTCLISMMAVNNETGHILPVQETFSAVKRRFPEIITHCDCVQAFMKLPVKAKMLCADLISLSGHKIHAAKGIGALCISKGTRLIPIITGGAQEKGIRSGTESVPLIAGFGAAADKLLPSVYERYERAAALKAYLLGRLGEIGAVKVNSPEDGSPYVINISAVGRRSEIMLHFLEQKGIYVSSGSACSKGAQSGVLAEFGLSRERADSALRVSITADTTEAELDAFVDALKEGYSKVRG